MKCIFPSIVQGSKDPRGSSPQILDFTNIVIVHFFKNSSLPALYELGEDYGVFLFLGFSRADERILAPFTKKTVHDTVPMLERIIIPDARNKV